jgi:hypothetical protein
MGKSATRTNLKPKRIALSPSHFIRDVLTDLGISDEYSEVYFIVCAHGPITVADLRRRLTQPAIVEEAVAKLEKLGLAFSTQFDGERQYEATPARLAMRSMVLDKLWREVPSEEYVRRLPPDMSKKLTQWEQRCMSCASRLEAFAPLPSPLRREPYRIIGDDAISGFLMKSVARGRFVLRAIVAPPWVGKLPMIWSAVTYIRGLGASYYRLSDQETFASFGYKINKRDMEDVGVELRILRRDPMSVPKIYLVDDSLAAVLQKDDSGERCTVYENPQEIDGQKAEFKGLWDESVPAEILLEQLEEQRGTFIRNAKELLTNAELEAYGFLLDYGVFCYPSHLKNVCRFVEGTIGTWSQKLVAHGLASEDSSDLGVLPPFKLEIPAWWHEDPRKREIFLEAQMPHKVREILTTIERNPGIGPKRLRRSLFRGISGERFYLYLNKLIDLRWIRERTSEPALWGRPTKGYEITKVGHVQLRMKLE